MEVLRFQKRNSAYQNQSYLVRRLLPETSRFIGFDCLLAYCASAAGINVPMVSAAALAGGPFEPHLSLKRPCQPPRRCAVGALSFPYSSRGAQVARDNPRNCQFDRVLSFVDFGLGFSWHRFVQSGASIPFTRISGRRWLARIGGCEGHAPFS